jgi:6-phosphofructokinase
VKHDNSVLAEACDVADDSLTTLPKGKVVAVTLVTIDNDVALTRVGIGKDW